LKNLPASTGRVENAAPYERSKFEVPSQLPPGVMPLASTSLPEW
jgi:hypothetical protein